MEKDTTYRVNFDQCRVNLTLPGSEKKIRKRTSLLTNSRHIVDLFSPLQCVCQEPHATVQGSHNGIKVSAHCQVYTPEFCSLLAEAALRHSMDAEADDV